MREIDGLIPTVIHIDNALNHLPDQVFSLVTNSDKDNQGGIEVRYTEHGDAMVVTYSSFSRLAMYCGAGQPWVQLSTGQVISQCREHNVALISLDLPIPEGHRYQEIPEHEKPELPRTQIDPEFGRYLYVPARPIHSGDTEAILELQPDHTSQIMLLAYTSEATLNAGCGPWQPWAKIPAERLDDVAAEAGAAGILFDAELPENVRYDGPVEDDWLRTR